MRLMASTRRAPAALLLREPMLAFGGARRATARASAVSAYRCQPWNPAFSIDISTCHLLVADGPWRPFMLSEAKRLRGRGSA